MSHFLEITEDQFNALTTNEQNAIERWLGRNEPPLSASIADKFYELFLQGNTCEQIHRLNPAVYMGAIVHARIRDRWDSRKNEYLSELYSNTKARLSQAQMESVHFAADMLAAVHKLNTEKVKRYLQTGNPEDLIGVTMLPTSIKSYKDLWETIQKATGQDKGTGGTGGVPQTQPQPPPPPTIETQPIDNTTNASHELIKKLLENKSK